MGKEKNPKRQVGGDWGRRLSAWGWGGVFGSKKRLRTAAFGWLCVQYGNQLTGTLPEDLGLPDGLLTLRLGANQFQGQLPQASALPTSLQRCANLCGKHSGAWPVCPCACLRADCADCAIRYGTWNGRRAWADLCCCAGPPGTSTQLETRPHPAPCARRLLFHPHPPPPNRHPNPSTHPPTHTPPPHPPGMINFPRIHSQQLVALPCRLDLDNASLEGTIPVSWAELPNATDILLMNNSLAGGWGGAAGGCPRAYE